MDATTRDALVKLVENVHGDRCVDVVLSDMMANTSGNPIRDSVASLDLCMAAFEFAAVMLKTEPSSAFICKYFMSREADEFRKDTLECRFSNVRAVKTAASRSESREQYWVCRGFLG
ncbi:methylene-fatty-acyl-phospholipid synthase [Malassezia cuniculi]|uniref:rRNA methyltransferase 2, mitochondrial n=1 Tax=Malassezia cuniculi TaxID=948313 RepID=A0AAF0EQB3_9BASI|nr:methylene-fatty-acyl-phospholipid synthase [Malassezia cuniculi]